MSSIKLRVAEYLELARAQGHLTHEQQATAAGLGSGTIHRLRNGQPASAGAIAAIMRTYGVDFEAVFEVRDIEATAKDAPKVAIAA